MRDVQSTMRTLLLALLISSTVSCATARRPSAAPESGAPAVTSGSAASASAALKVHEETEAYEFFFGFPAEAGAIAPLRAQLEALRAERRRELLRSVEEAHHPQGDADAAPHPQTDITLWSLQASVPGWLSLRETRDVYYGGAHPFQSSGALLWDVDARVARDARELFQSRQALTAALRSPFCEGVDRERAERRGQPVNRDSDDGFDACLDPAELPLVLRSSNGQRFDELEVLVDAYVAGPYVEGSYHQRLPVTPSVLAALRAEYRGSFALTR